ncbi:low temperature requirement protein A [Streptomyces sp. So13.3]|uniref:low temperature requirement protein A n=1 Tax=Streptomyces TaxID=1883 RepID=UPI00110631C6|nr:MULTISPECIES: low temperature requirement protein A [Streptomyces]MCZ4100066.1 low temperature requirement protein A [Streptomyces sp. H39-C1]QNA74786.1 low temperature requirement protein A [Streptomyces sp. So13.3]
MAEAEKRVTWAELFFDLVFVFAITQVSALLHEDHSWAGVGRALIVFVPPYWAWVGMSLHANRQDVDNPLDRIGIFAVGLSALFMGLALPLAYDGRGVLYGASYWAARLVLWALVLRWQDVRLSAFAVGACLTGPMLLAGGFLDGPARTALWGSAALIDLSMPFLLRRRLSRVRFHPGHLPERFGLFLIVALGESIVAIGAPASAAAHLDAAELTAVAAAFTLAAGLWWVYFAFAASAIQHALATSDRQTDTIREVLSYAHVGFLGGVIAVAVGMHDAVAHPAARLGTGVAGLLFGGCALFLAVFGYTRWRMFRLWSTTRLAASAVVLAVLPLAARLPAVGALGLLALLIAALNVLEWERVRRAGSL